MAAGPAVAAAGQGRAALAGWGDHGGGGSRGGVAVAGLSGATPRTVAVVEGSAAELEGCRLAPAAGALACVWAMVAGGGRGWCRAARVLGGRDAGGGSRRGMAAAAAVAAARGHRAGLWAGGSRLAGVARRGW